MAELDEQLLEDSSPSGDEAPPSARAAAAAADADAAGAGLGSAAVTATSEHPRPAAAMRRAPSLVGIAADASPRSSRGKGTKSGSAASASAALDVALRVRLLQSAHLHTQPAALEKMVLAANRKAMLDGTERLLQLLPDDLAAKVGGTCDGNGMCMCCGR